MNIKTVIFDFNGVFLVSQPLSKRLEDKYGVSVDEIFPVLKEALKKAKLPNSNSDGIWEPLLKLLNISKEILFDFWFSGEKIDEELINYKNELFASGYKVIILSNNFLERTTYYRKFFPELFENITKSYFSWETGLVKPDPRVYETLLKENNLVPSECIYFDDSEDNVKTAHDLGINSFVYKDLSETVKVVDSFK